MIQSERLCIIYLHIEIIHLSLLVQFVIESTEPMVSVPDTQDFMDSIFNFLSEVFFIFIHHTALLFFQFFGFTQILNS